ARPGGLHLLERLCGAAPRARRDARDGFAGRMIGRRVLFRADASHGGGFGHVARVCALIEELNDRGAEPIAMFGGDAPGLGSWCTAHGIEALIGNWSVTQLIQ